MSAPPANDSRTYSLTVSGYKVAVSTITLHREGDIWQVERQSEPRGMVANLFASQFSEFSRFQVIDGNMQPLSYRLDEGGEISEATIDGDLVSLPNGKTGSLSGYDVAADVGSLPYIFTVINPDQSLGKRVAVINHKRVAPYVIADVSRETLDIKGIGTIETVRVRADSIKQENRYTILWLDPDSLLPVQMEQYNKRSFLLTQIAAEK
ncbi:DUF3108 domain-containing protein [Gammaproteobacteria bacterium]|nr:DUF3108 domain-containing protein [Gammaproteobacteria bacterium]